MSQWKEDVLTEMRSGFSRLGRDRLTEDQALGKRIDELAIEVRKNRDRVEQMQQGQ